MRRSPFVHVTLGAREVGLRGGVTLTRHERDSETEVMSRRSMTDIRETVLAAQRSGFEFLRSDAELAMALLDRATNTRDAAVKTRNVNNAISAYRTIHRLAKRAHLNSQQRSVLNEALAELGNRLSKMLQPPPGSPEAPFAANLND